MKRMIKGSYEFERDEYGQMMYDENTWMITIEYWQDIQSGEEVESGFGYTLTAPKEEGTYTLYELVSESNTHKGWLWVRQ